MQSWVSLPFCDLSFKAPKRCPEGYPDQLLTVGDHVRKKRLDSGISRCELIALMGIAPMTLTGWEQYGRQPWPKQWAKIISFLGYEPFAEPTTTAEKLVAIRRRLGISRKTLAKCLGVGPRVVSRWEAGEAVHKRMHREVVEALFQTQGSRDYNAELDTQDIQEIMVRVLDELLKDF